MEANMTRRSLDHRVPAATCLNCKKIVDGAACADLVAGRGPKPNDVSVCAYCGHLQAYDDNLMFRELNDEEIVECAGDPELLAAQEFAKAFREWRKERT
jgi:hypothetical protein